ncbi:MAG: 4Fe-4S ferredoxin [Desulfococcus sp. 4484_241]|nr:MAG: 4Fe-4S ferredoxin [Desulfococcus sp. 4484_241]
MASTVFFTDLSANYQGNLLTKLGRLMEAAGVKDVVKERDLAAVKLHFGEMGNTAYIRPVFLRKVVEVLKGLGAVPFLTDANTVYAGTRSDAPHHLETAIHNGFAYSVVGAPIIIADGLRGKSDVAVEINQKRFREVYVAAEIARADALVSVAHFKGHELAGFGGAIKNVGMGAASRRGKLAQHSTVSPKVKKKTCVGCGECVKNCAQQAISLKEKKAVIDGDKCVGCGECIVVCPTGSVQIQWNQSGAIFLENMVEYTLGVLKGKEDKSLFVNFVTDVSPGCDCFPYNDAPIVRDIGIFASRDPVAIDQACADMVNREGALEGARMKKNRNPGEDKFRGIYPSVEWEIQLEYAQQLGLGSRDYTIEKL